MDIITTIGPATWSPDMVKSLLELDVHCIRFPFSKETPEGHVERAAMVKQVAKDNGKSIMIMADLPGSKPRFNNPAPLEVNTTATYRISLLPLNESEIGSVDFALDPGIEALSAETKTIIIGDGENAFTIEAFESPTVIRGKFYRNGILERRRAFIPTGSQFAPMTFTSRDQEFARFAQKGEFDWIALSFVGSAEDVVSARNWFAHELGWKPYIVAKIETERGVLHAGEIAKVSDAVMIARGDLALQVGFDHLWGAQRKILKACVDHKTYVIVATGLLEYFDQHGYPSRSECIDVSTALDMGTNALMLSAETTIGKRPLETVGMLRTLSTGWKNATK